MAQSRGRFLQTIALDSVVSVVAAYGKTGITKNNFAVSIVDLTDRDNIARGDFKGGKFFYPASTVKLFFLVAAYLAREDFAKLETALLNMIVTSSNEATSCVVDALTGTVSGAKLPPGDMARWTKKREKLNRIFRRLGYSRINIINKTWDDEPGGRDSILRAPNGGRNNRLRANDVAKLLASIVCGAIAYPGACKKMMKLLQRNYCARSTDPDDQATAFIGAAVPPRSRLWSKAGWTSTVRHDAAYIEFPNGNCMVLVIFTKGCSENREIIPALADEIIFRFNS